MIVHPLGSTTPEEAGRAADRCRVCGADSGLTSYEAREMMFGLRESFRYFQCAECGCLQLAEAPADLSRYYPEDYYAHAQGEHRSAVFRTLRRLRNRHALLRRGLVGRMLSALSSYPFPTAHHWLARNGLREDSRILDVGCGAGLLLRDLRGVGFTRLLGVDPYVDADVVHDEGLRILKLPLEEVEGAFDLIMFHHALEHIPDQVGTLRHVARLLAPEGECVIRIPTVSSFAWEHYRENWVQIDAPRHFFLHSTESLRRVARQAGLEVVEIEYDSTDLQFVGSELYARDLPLTAAEGAFTRREIREFRRRARELNAEGRGDSIAAYLRRAGSPRAKGA